MCFYVKRHLDYKPYQRPSYVVLRENEAFKAQQRAKEQAKEEAEQAEEQAAARNREVEDALLATV